MKTFVIALLFVSTSLFAQSEKMIKAIEKNLEILDTASTIETALLLKNNFERIAEAEKGEWIPQYYAAMANATLSMREKDTQLREEIVNKAEMYINRADSLEPDNSEIQVVRAMTVYSRITVSPMERFMSLQPVADKYMAKAEELNPDNPRIYLQKGVIMMFTPEMMGGGKTKALPLILTAIEKFDQFEPESSIHPNWGKNIAEEMLKRAKGQ